MKGSSYLILFGIDALLELLCPLFFPSYSNIRFITKPLLMILLMFYVYVQKQVEDKSRIILALIFAWMGDVFLMIPGNDPLYFQLGLGSFLLMQISYISLFIRHFVAGKPLPKSYIYLSLALIVGYVVIFLNFLLPHILLRLQFPVIIYAIALGSMLYFALMRQANSDKKNFTFIAFGAFFFVVSDSLLAFGKFYYSFPGNSFLVMFTYIISQLLLIKGLVTFVPFNK
jgi:uncharacterized membrane protein YhhN